MEKLILKDTEKAALNAGFASVFGGAPERYFSAPGRTELSGNHTDHQRGRVLAGAVNLDMQAAVRANGTDTILTTLPATVNGCCRSKWVWKSTVGRSAVIIFYRVRPDRGF